MSFKHLIATGVSVSVLSFGLLVHAATVPQLDPASDRVEDRQQVRVLWFGASVAAYVQVPSFFGGNDPEIFALCLRTFTYTARDCRFQLVR